MRVRFFDIEWETDGEEVDLPTECVLEVDEEVPESLDMDLATFLNEEGANLLSDAFGWLVQGFQWKLTNKEERGVQ